MSLTRFNRPFAPVTRFQPGFGASDWTDPMTDMMTTMNQMMTDPFFNTGALTTLPSMDIRETPSAFIVSADVPGFTRDQIEINADGSTLYISGQYETVKESDDVFYHHRERRRRSFNRTFTLPMDIPADKIEANLEGGILTLNIPKTDIKAKRIAIK
jgi:HSP20 family protein